MKNLKLVIVNTTAYLEENMTIVTDLSNEQIIEVITPIVHAERNDEKNYTNEDLLEALNTKFGETSFILEANKPINISI